MGEFLKRHKAVHIWALALLAIFGAYWYGISGTDAANRVSAITQMYKDGMGRICCLCPFSVAECLYIAYIIGILAYLAVFFHRLRTRPHKGDTAYGGLLGLACLGLTAYGLYCLLWGVNYYADGFQEKSGIYAQPVAVEDLTRVAEYFVQELEELSGQVERDENSVFAVPRNDIFAASTGIYANACQEFPFLFREDKIPKSAMLSRLYSAMNFTGFYSPYTGEANLNVDFPACLLPSTIAHELAHQRGFASEQECNFIAILVSTRCSDPVYRYSGYLMGYIHLANALYRVSPERWSQLYDTLPEEVKADLRDHSAYWDQFDGLTATVSQKIYDASLKSYGESSGVQSYGMVVDLLVAYY